ncbi:MAG TPA: SpoIIE family protein phosphatase [Jatrophihabitans sp.]
MPVGRLEERLSNLLAVTDVRLTRLDVDDLLVEVLDRLRAILDADTAAVLLRQQPRDDFLVARAACGLEDEVRQGVRVPIGAGFAGTIAARREPVILDRVDQTTVANPVLWEKGIRRMVGVPLLVGAELLGVLHVGRLQDQPFGEADVELLQVAGDRIASAVQTRRLAVESAAGAILERALMPGRLPALPGLQLAARYAPAQDRSVGGDWYDAFVLPSGQLWLVIGDVAGHGLLSAVAVSRVRSAMRSYALLGHDPSEVLAMTNRKLLHFEIDTMVTTLCAVAEAPFERFTLVSAAHPPPVVATPAGTDLARVVPGPPLGAIEDAHFVATQVELPPRSTMVLYTDGLIERRGESIDVGLGRLRAAVANDPPENVCRDVMLRLVGSTATVDDVAVLAAGRDDSSPVEAVDETLLGELVLPPDTRSVAQARAFALNAAGDLTPDVRGALKLLVSEVTTNSVVHARSDFTVRVFRSAGALRVECGDSGEGMVEVHDADPSDTHGRGIFFVRQFAAEWGVRRAEPGPGKVVWFALDLDRGGRPAAGQPARGATGDAAPLVLELAGEIDMSRTEDIELRAGVLLRDATAGQQIVVDLARADFIDSSGLSGLLQLRRRAVAHGVPLRLRAVPPNIAALLQMAGIDHVLPVE